MKNPYLVVPSYLTPSLLNDYKSLDWTGFSAVVCISGSVFRWTGALLNKKILWSLELFYFLLLNLFYG